MQVVKLFGVFLFLFQKLFGVYFGTLCEMKPLRKCNKKKNVKKVRLV
jgi:hypothetical protein